MDCRKCGAPLPLNQTHCEHCGVTNDIDLRSVRAPTVRGPHTDRVCPHCDREMVSVDLRVGKGFFVEQCEDCWGLFFDPRELEYVIDEAVLPSIEADMQRMRMLAEEAAPNYSDVKYVKCPVCREIMNRRNFGARSGVIVDRCSRHGVWLDGGEMRRLLLWVKAGGLEYDRQQRDQMREDRRKEKSDLSVRDGGIVLPMGRRSVAESLVPDSSTWKIVRAVFGLLWLIKLFLR